MEVTHTTPRPVILGKRDLAYLGAQTSKRCVSPWDGIVMGCPETEIYERRNREMPKLRQGIGLSCFRADLLRGRSRARGRCHQLGRRVYYSFQHIDRVPTQRRIERLRGS